MTIDVQHFLLIHHLIGTVFSIAKSMEGSTTSETH